MSLAHPLGTDNLGRDTFARLLAGGRLSLAVGVAAMASLTVGTVMGVLSGYFRRLDGPLMRFTDLFLALPVLPLLMVSTMLFREPARRAGPGGGHLLPDRRRNRHHELDADRPHRARPGARHARASTWSPPAASAPAPGASSCATSPTP